MSAADFILYPKSHLFTPEEAEKRKYWARRFAAEFAGAARGIGYGVFLGGSLIRDIDLLAMPWREGPKSLTHTQFVLEMCHIFPLTMGNQGETLFGHRWYALWHKDHKDHQIDLKIVLPAAKQSKSDNAFSEIEGGA